MIDEHGPAIETRDLVRSYRSRRSADNPQGTPVVALDGVSLASLIFTVAERRARQLGVLDQESMY